MPLTDARTEVAAAYERGDDIPTLALRYQRTEETIVSWLRAEGALPPRPQRQPRYVGPCDCGRVATIGRQCRTCYQRDYRRRSKGGAR